MKLARPRPSDEMIPIRGGADAWSAGLSAIFVELEFVVLDQAKPPSGRMYRYPFGDMTFVRAVTRGGAHRVVRTDSLIRSSGHNNFFVGFMLSGEATLTQGEGRALIEPGDIAILDSTREYAIEVPRSFDALWIRVPRHRLEGRLNALTEIMAQKIDGHSGVGHVASNMLRAALDEAPRLAPREANRIANSLLDLLSLALAKEQVDARDAPTNYRASTLRRVQEYVEERLDDEDLSSTSIARAHNVSSRYLNKLFEKEGISISRWVRMRRLERCRLDLEDASMSGRMISDIAYQHGFGNVSHFNRAFKARFGCSPSAFRDAR